MLLINSFCQPSVIQNTYYTNSSYPSSHHHTKWLHHDQVDKIYAFGDYSQGSFFRVYTSVGGSLLFSNTFPTVQEAVMAKVVNDSTFALTGNIGNNIWVALVGKDATLIWADTLSGPDNLINYAADVESDSLGNIYVIGEVDINTGNPFQYSDIGIFKFDYAGNLIWQNFFNGTNNKDDQGHSLLIDNNLNVYISGQEEVIAYSGSWDALLVKYDAGGNFIWKKIFDGGSSFGSHDDFGKKMLYKDGKIYLSCIEEVLSQQEREFVYRIDTSGTIDWSYNNSIMQIENVVDVEFMSDTSFVILGTYMNNYEIITEMNLSGIKLSEGVNYESGITIPMDMAIDTNKYVCVTGTYGQANISDIFIHVFNSRKELDWETYYPTATSDDSDGNCIVIENNSNKIFVGGMQEGVSNYRACITKYCSANPYCFSTPTTINTTADFGNGCLGDFNSDNFPDLALIQTSPLRLNIYFNNSGDLSGSPVYHNINQLADSLLSADFNNDGYDDIVMFTKGQNFFYILINNQSNGFYSQIVVNTGSPINDIHITDLNNDMGQDIITLNSDTTIKSYINNNNLTFSTFITDSLPGIANRLSSGDFDNDGITDIMYCQREGTWFQQGIYFCKGNGNGLFQSPVIKGAELFEFRTYEINQDGNPDLVGFMSGKFYTYYGNGAGGFSSQVMNLNMSLINSQSAIKSFGIGLNAQNYDKYFVWSAQTVNNAQPAGSFLLHSFNSCKNSYSDPYLLNTGYFGQTIVADINMDGESDYLAIYDFPQKIKYYTGCSDNPIGFAICPSVVTTILDTFCVGESYQLPDGSFTTTGGIYYDSLLTVNNCDSISKLILTQENISIPVTILNDTIYTDYNASYFYTWFDCTLLSSIPNNFNFYIPSQNGTYAVIANSGTCIDTSQCVNFFMTGTEEIIPFTYSILTNPVNNELRIITNQNDYLFEMYNVSGKLVKKLSYSKKDLALDMSDIQAGVYFIFLRNDRYSIATKIIKIE